MNRPWVVMRSRNDFPVITETLEMLKAQKEPHRLLVLDNNSTDGTREAAAAQADMLVDVPEGSYVPGRVLNLAMSLTDGERVAFLNSDCTPADSDWLGPLLSGFDGDGTVAAVFGRQLPRPDCLPLFAADTEATFGDGSRQRHWRHCFSMASSAISRSAWVERPFNELIQYSEDIEWTWNMRERGHIIRYVPESRVFHSHNYTIAQWHRRQRGEGRAEARIFTWSAWDRSLPRYSLLPFARQVLADVRHCARIGRPLEALRAPLLRGAGMLGRRRGFLEGLREGEPGQ